MVAKKAPAKATAKKATARPRTAAQNDLRVQEAQRTSAKDWLLSQRGNQVEVPSGNVALLRRPGPEMFFKAGMVPDALTGIVNESVREKQGLRPEKVKDMAGDPAMMPKMLAMIDSAVVDAVVEPPVRSNPDCMAPMPSDPELLCNNTAADDIHSKVSMKDYHKFIEGDRIPEDQREPMFLYCSEIDFNDKVFIFQYAVGGSPDLVRFREEYSELMAGVSAGTDSPE
jgi:hypothetical protein